MFEKFIKLVKVLKTKVTLTASYFKQQGRGKRWKYSLWSMLLCQLLFAAKKFTSFLQLSIYVHDTENEESRQFRKLCGWNENVPDRRTIERRLEKYGDRIREIIQHIGKIIIRLGIVKYEGRATDTTMIPADGNVWHKKDKEAGRIPSCGNIDTEAQWGMGSKGWNYGWKGNLLASIQDFFIPLDADFHTANVSDNKQYANITQTVTRENKFVLADGSFDDDKLYDYAKEKQYRLIAGMSKKLGRGASSSRRKRHRFFFSKKGQALYRKRGETIEPLNGLLKELFPGLRKSLVKGYRKNKAYFFSCILLYQCAVLTNHECQRPVQHVKHIIY